MAFLDTLGAEIKASFKRIPFSSVGGGGYQANNALANWNGSMLGNRQPGATLNYDELAGDPLDNRVVAACIEAISSALPEAPPILEKRKGDDWERIPDHPVLDLLHRPNDYHTTYHLWNATIGSELTAADGSAYWQVVMNKAGSAPTELWFEPRVRPRWSATEFISGYEIERDGKWIDVKNDQIIHFRNSLNPYNTRLGRNALSAGKRQITGDNAAATYHSALLRNSAVASLLVTLKDGGTSTLTPEQLDDYMQALTNKLRGEGAGKIAGSNLPIDVHKLAYSPDEMAIDTLIAYYEVSICALLKVPAMVIGLGGGADGKTYSNYAEAIRDFWMRTIIPAQNRRGAEITTQLLPLFGLDASQHRISFDYKNVAALTEDDNPLMDVLVKACGSAFMTVDEARARLKMEPLKKGVELAAPKPAAEEGKAPPKVEAKSWDESQHHRAQDGKFGSGTSSTRTPAFKAWFGESKVIDSNGAPQVNHGVSAPAVVYHGVANVTSEGDAWGMVFTPHRADAESNGDEPMAAYLSIQKPFSMSVLELHNSANKAESVIKDLQQKGFDGLHVQTGDYQEWIAFNPTQVKAVDASHFDASDPNPYKSWSTKRFDPNEPRDEDGKWSGGGSSNATSTAAKKGVMRAATKEESKSLGIPPAYTDVLITDDPGSELKATAKSSKGKVQYYYTPEYSQRQAAAKFDRVKELHNELPSMRSSWNAEISNGGKNAHEALALRLISQTGFRVGGLDGGGDVAAYGASSLLMSHAKVSGNRIEFDFMGKGGHRQQHSLVDSVLAKHIESRKGKETVFDTNDAKVRDYLKRTGGEFKVHDLRTRTASAMAAHYVGSAEKTNSTPRTAQDIKARKNQIADKVAEKLGDTRSVVLSSYIAPQVWESWG